MTYQAKRQCSDLCCSSLMHAHASRLMSLLSVHLQGELRTCFFQEVEDLKLFDHVVAQEVPDMAAKIVPCHPGKAELTVLHRWSCCAECASCRDPQCRTMSSSVQAHLGALLEFNISRR